MKKLTALLIAALVLSIAFIAAPVSVYAAEDEMTVLYAYVPDSWENPRAWAWGPRGDAFPAWPGGEMQADPNNPGWYFIHLPSDKTGALVSADVGDGREQTTDFPFDGTPIWVTIHTYDNMEYTHEQQTEGDLPVPITMVIMYAQIPDNWETPRAWAWGPRGDAFAAWPGGEMQADPNNPGWYFIHLPSDKTGALVSADVGDGREQTSDFPFDGTPIWITVNAYDDMEYTSEQLTTGEFPVYVPTEAAPEAFQLIDAIVVYAYIPEGWEAPGIWAWGPRGNAFDEWPGGSMSPDANNPGWYYAFLPADKTGVIINANDGEAQTGNMDFAGLPLWVTINDYEGEDFEYTNVQQTEGDVPTREAFEFGEPEEEDRPDVGYITVRAFVPDTWENPGVWAWNDDYGNVFPGWPGQPFTEMDGDWHVMELPAWMNEIIINAAGVQTDDMEVEMGEDLWIIVMGYRHSYVFNEAVDPRDLAALGIEEPQRVEVVFGPIDDGEDEAPAPVVEDDDSGAPVVLIAVISAAVVAVLGVGVFMITKKKKQQ